MNVIEKISKEQHGFILPEDVPKLIKINRLMPVLVRCGGGRFTCPVQDVEHFIDIITKEGTDYIRDVSFVAGHNYK